MRVITAKLLAVGSAGVQHGSASTGDGLPGRPISAEFLAMQRLSTLMRGSGRPWTALLWLGLDASMPCGRHPFKHHMQKLAW